MKAFVYKTSGMKEQGKTLEAADLGTICERLLILEDFKGWKPEIILSKPDEDPYDEREKECDWVIEIYDDYRE